MKDKESVASNMQREENRKKGKERRSKRGRRKSKIEDRVQET